MIKTIKKISYFAFFWMIGCFLSYTVAQNVDWALHADYDEIAEFVDGVAAIKKDGKWGYVSDKGTLILAPAYDIAYPFSEGMGVLASADQMLVAIVDRTGNLIPIRDNFMVDGRFAAFSDGLLLVSKSNKWGYLNKSGVLGIECKYDLAQPFSEGLAAAVLNMKQCYCWYYMDVTGKPYFHINTKNVYWALGFHDGKALILHSKGAVFVNRNGKEEKGNLPQITPPSDGAAYHIDHTLACKEGKLIFDEKCRAVSFVAHNSGETRFIVTPIPINKAIPDQEVLFAEGMKPKEVRWINESTAIIKTSDAKIGMLTSDIEKPLLHFSSSSDTIFSVFGNAATLDLNIRNASSGTPNKIEVFIDGKLLPHSSRLPLPEPGKTVSGELPFDKITEHELETKESLINFYENGLLIGKYEKKIFVKNKPSLLVTIPDSVIIVEAGEDFYSVEVIVKNTADVAAENITVTLQWDGFHTKEIERLNRKSTKTVSFYFDKPAATIPETKAELAVKVPGTPMIQATENIVIEVPTVRKLNTVRPVKKEDPDIDP